MGPGAGSGGDVALAAATVRHGPNPFLPGVQIRRRSRSNVTLVGTDGALPRRYRALQDVTGALWDVPARYERLPASRAAAGWRRRGRRTSTTEGGGNPASAGQRPISGQWQGKQQTIASHDRNKTITNMRIPTMPKNGHKCLSSGARGQSEREHTDNRSVNKNRARKSLR